MNRFATYFLMFSLLASGVLAQRDLSGYSRLTLHSETTPSLKAVLDYDLLTTLPLSVTGTGTANVIPMFTDSDKIGDSPITRNGNNIGFGGETEPIYPIDVEGDINIDNGGLRIGGQTVITSLWQLIAASGLLGDLNLTGNSITATDNGGVQILTNAGDGITLNDDGTVDIPSTLTVTMLDAGGLSGIVGIDPAVDTAVTSQVLGLLPNGLWGPMFADSAIADEGDPVFLAMNTEAKLEAHLVDVTDVFTNNDGALDDDDLTDNNIGELQNVSVDDAATSSSLVFDGSNWVARTLPSHSITSTDISNWDEAYSWGDHADEGYLTGVSWGDITGTLSSQTDLQSALDAKQPLDSDLTALAGQTGTGLLVRTGTGTMSARTITGGTGISVTNGNGVNGNPTIAVVDNYVLNTGDTMTGPLNLSGTELRVNGTQVLSNARALTNITSHHANTANVGAGATSSNARIGVNPGNLAAYPSLGTSGGGLTLGSNFGLDIGVRGNGNSWIQVHRFDGTPTAYNLILQPSGGNVGIGAETPTEKLDVNGDTRVRGGTLQVGNATNAAYNRIGTTASNWGLAAATDLLIGGKLEVDGTLYADGDSVLSGNVYLGGPSGSQYGRIFHITTPDALVLYSETDLALVSTTKRLQIGDETWFMDFNGLSINVGGLGLPVVDPGFVDVASYSQAVLFVDSNDGDLKVRFPNGTLKTIATDN